MSAVCESPQASGSAQNQTAEDSAAVGAPVGTGCTAETVMPPDQAGEPTVTGVPPAGADTVAVAMTMAIMVMAQAGPVQPGRMVQVQQAQAGSLLAAGMSDSLSDQEHAQRMVPPITSTLEMRSSATTTMTTTTTPTTVTVTMGYTAVPFNHWHWQEVQLYPLLPSFV